MKNACLEIALRELETAGVRGIEQARGAKHLQLRWRVNGCDMRMYTIPCTPSDVRAPNNVRADVRRLLRQDGVLTMSEPKVPPSKPPNCITMLEQRCAALEQRCAALEAGDRTICKPHRREENVQ